MIDANRTAVGVLNELGEKLIVRYTEEIEGAQMLVRQGKPEMATAAIARSTAFKDVMQDLSSLVREYES